MKRHIRLYREYLKLSFATFFEYRGNVLSESLSSLMWGVFHIISLLLISSGVKEIFGWKTYELLILVGVHSVIMGSYHAFITSNLYRMSLLIHHGDLDLLLLKPVDTQFQLSFRTINFPSVARVLAGALFVGYMLRLNRIYVPGVGLAGFVLLSLVAMVLLYAVWFLVLTVTVWYSNLYNITDLLSDLGGVTKFPKEMFRQLHEYVFLFLLPLLLVMTVPTKMLLGRPELGEIVVLVVSAACLFYLSRVFWRYALRSYTSASS